MSAVSVHPGFLDRRVRLLSFTFHETIRYFISHIQENLETLDPMASQEGEETMVTAAN